MKNDNKIRLSDYVISWLFQKGINTIFTVSGGGSIFLCDALSKDDRIKYICCHHEQAVSFAAEGYARANSKIGVGIVTTGPGGTNVLTGLAAAWIDSVPMLIISGQVFLNQTIGNTNLRQLGVQESNIVDLAKPVTKYSKMITNKDNIKFELEKCIDIACSGRPGPVLLDIPADIQNSYIEKNKLKNFKSKSQKLVISETTLELVVQKLTSAKRPIIHVGHGLRNPLTKSKLISFLNKTQIPVMTTWNATDVIPSDFEYFIGRPGAFAKRGANFNIQNCDFYLSIGTRLPFMVTGYNKLDYARNAYKVMVDIDQNELNNHSDFIDQLINADALDFLNNLDRKIPKSFKAPKNWLEMCKAMNLKYPLTQTVYVNQNEWVYSYYFIDKLSEISKNSTNIITDMGLSFVGTHMGFKVKDGQNIFTNSGNAPMGWGLPAAIGAYYSNQNKNTICLTGEGGLMMNIQELSTIMHNDIPIKIFIYNNGGYQTIKQTQVLGFQGRLMGCDSDSGISFPKFDKIAKAFQIKYHLIKNNNDVDKHLPDLIKEDGPSIIELLIDPEQQHVPKAINKRSENGMTIPTNFEDMYPFLSKNEVKDNLI